MSKRRTHPGAKINYRMKARAALWLCAAFILLTAVLSGCTGGQRTELVILPDEPEALAGGTGGRPFEVRSIYRMPASEASVARPLGWSDPDTVVTMFANIRSHERLEYAVQRWDPPYAEASMPLNVKNGVNLANLSPDGRYLTGTARTGDGVAVKLLSLRDGEERTVAELAEHEVRLISEAGAWSANSRYLAFLLVGMAPAEDRAVQEAQTRSIRVLIFDASNGTTAQYPLNGLNAAMSGVRVIPSDDAGALLMVSESAVMVAERNGSVYDVRFRHPDEGEKEGEGIVQADADWVNGDQFVYLDGDGTLHAYDRRNGENVTLLVKVNRFRLSRDRKAIAYFENGQDTVYAGKLQGNNILYAQPVYQGVLPYFMDWSPDGKRLLIDGRKLYAQTGRTPRSASVAEPAEIRPNAAEAAEDQQLIIEFR